jgi:hypothetical protein
MGRASAGGDSEERAMVDEKTGGCGRLDTQQQHESEDNNTTRHVPVM